MPRRAGKYISDTAKKLKDPNYAEAYMKAAIYNHDQSFKVALAGMIDRFGHSELADLIGMQPSNVTRQVKRLLNNDPIKDETLERLLSGFGLTLAFDVAVAEMQHVSNH